MESESYLAKLKKANEFPIKSTKIYSKEDFNNFSSLKSVLKPRLI